MLAVPVLGICASSSGMGKTTLIARLLPLLAAHGLKASVIKQVRADVDLDRPGKDSYRFREAGAAQVLVSSPTRWALMTEHAPDDDDQRLFGLIQHMNPSMADVVLVEGFRTAPIPKIEVHRQAVGKSLIAARDPNVIAIASDVPINASRRVLNLNAADKIADFIVGWLAREKGVRAVARLVQTEAHFTTQNNLSLEATASA
jgi:molybdopterin-guanine dinucleotide biosynthesis adapter protein